jgi:hypothetical protein
MESKAGLAAGNRFGITLFSDEYVHLNSILLDRRV